MICGPHGMPCSWFVVFMRPWLMVCGAHDVLAHGMWFSWCTSVHEALAHGVWCSWYVFSWYAVLMVCGPHKVLAHGFGSWYVVLMRSWLTVCGAHGLRCS